MVDKNTLEINIRTNLKLATIFTFKTILRASVSWTPRPTYENYIRILFHSKSVKIMSLFYMYSNFS